MYVTGCPVPSPTPQTDWCMKIFPFVLQLSNYLHQSPPTLTETPHVCGGCRIILCSYHTVCIVYYCVYSGLLFHFPSLYKFMGKIGVEADIHPHTHEQYIFRTRSLETLAKTLRGQQFRRFDNLRLSSSVNNWHLQVHVYKYIRVPVSVNYSLMKTTVGNIRIAVFSVFWLVFPGIEYRWVFLATQVYIVAVHII